MNVHEYQGKEILRKYGVATPRGFACFSVDEAVKAAALSVGLNYIDTLQARWFTGSASRFIGGDGIHPTDEGHRYIANLLVPLVTRLLPAGYVIPKL